MVAFATPNRTPGGTTYPLFQAQAGAGLPGVNAPGLPDGNTPAWGPDGNTPAEGDPDWGPGGNTPVAGPTVAPVPPGATGLGARIKAAYTEASKRAGRHLTWDDPTVLLIWQVLGGLTPDQARTVSQQGAEYASQNGRLLSDAEVEQAVTQARTAQPNQYDVGYGLGDAVQQAFQTVQSQYPGETLTGADPRLLAAVRQNPELAGITPEQLDQIIQAGRAFTWSTGQLAGSGLDTMIGHTLRRPPLPMPHQMNAAAFEALYGAGADPTAKALAEAALKRRGWDPVTYQRQHYAARPVGTAAPATSTAWGSTPTGVWG